MMYVVGSRGYTPVRDQQLGVPNSMHASFNNDEDKGYDRVHEWIAQQHRFAGLPPPEEESLFRSHSVADINNKDVSSITDSSIFNEWVPNYPSEDEIYKFSGIEMNKYYSPNMTRRRGYIPRSDPSLSNAQFVVNGNRSNLSQLSRQHNGDTRGSPIASSSRGSPVAWSPFNRYYYGSGEGNTFPRRSKVNKYDEKRNLFTSSIMDHPQERPSCFDDPFSPRQHDERTNERFLSNQVGEKTISNHYNSYQRSNSESIDHALDDEAICSTAETPSYTSNGMKFAVTKEVKSPLADKNSSLISGMSLDTQRLLTGNLPDVALTAAKAIHKRELSDSLPKYKGPIKSLFHHVRMSSAPESSHLTNGEEKSKQVYDNTNCKPCEVRKVKAFSWPKRATLPSLPSADVKDEIAKNNTTIKTESGYNTEKSEEKNDGPLEEEEIDKTIDTHSLSKESETSDQSSEDPPARPPLPSQKVYAEKKSPQKEATPISSRDSPITSLDVQVSAADVHLKRSVATDHLSSISNSSSKTSDSSHQYTSIKYLRGKSDHAADCTVSAFCSSTTDLTRNVSMSLKDLIRIHEQEIARVSASTTATGSTRLKSNESMHEKYRKCSITESKARAKSVWKRHTTIGLLTHFNGVNSEKDLLDYKTTDKLPLTPFSSNEVTASSSIVFCEQKETDNASAPNSPPSCSSKYVRKRNAPLTLPKPTRASLNSLVFDNALTVKSNDIKSSTISNSLSSQPLSPSSISPSSCKDASVQTELVLLDLEENDATEKILFMKEKKELESKFEKEKQLMQRKLDEQKKVANAYQKLEDRYRRKVYELQKALHMCTCSKGKTKFDTTYFAESRIGFSPDNHDLSVQKVDGILHQLEAWLNNQTNGIRTDTSEFSSLIGSNEETCSRYRVPPEHYTNPPLEIIDQIDATSV